jgi:DNA-binding transcriptional ArsR family regulator
MDETLKIMKALSDATRLKIVKLLLDGEKCVCEIFPHVKRTQSTTSIQLGKLEKSGILKSRKEGKKVFYSIYDLRVCDVFKAVGDQKGKILKKCCCVEGYK